MTTLQLRNTLLRRNFAQQSLRSPLLESEKNPGVTIATLTRQKYRKYLGELLLSPLEKIGNRVLYCKTVHAHVVLSGFELNVFLNNVLISFYSKLGALQSAAYVFDKMPVRSLISWSSMINAYNQNGYHAEALVLFGNFMNSGNDRPNEFVLATVMQSCTHLASIEHGMCIHGLVFKSGHNQDAHVGTSLIDFYAKTNYIDAARLVFEDLGSRTVVIWTAIIMGFLINGRSNVSLDLFKEMVETGIVPDKYAISCVLRACSMLELLAVGKQVHAFGLRNDLLDVSVSNVLIDFYGKCGAQKLGQRIFYQMMVKNVISWSTMISANMQNGFNYEAMDLYQDMFRLGWIPDDFACASVLTSCSSVGVLNLGKQIHAYTVKVNLDSDEFVLNSLIDMYCKCNSLTDARRVFCASVRCSAVCYNAIIEGYSRLERLNEAIDLFNEMRRNSVLPNQLTFVSLLGSAVSQFTACRQLHTIVIKSGCSADSYVGSALIDAYSKCSTLTDARLVFEEINDKDIVAWNSMLFGYTFQSETEKAHKHYLEFLQHGQEKPNQYTLIAVIRASSSQASLLHGLQFHGQAIKIGLASDPFVTNALMDMYAKCGSFDEAESLFNRALQRDAACWNSIISMHAQCGNAWQAVHKFNQMKAEGIQPDYITLIAVLSACAHAGLLEAGFHHFNSMSEFRIEPGEAHYSCMVSLLCRAGKLHQAKLLIETMPIQPTSVMWKSLLSACRDNKNVELGLHAAEMAISIDEKDSGSYVLLSNILAAKGMWSDVKEVRRKMESNSVVKETGCSWIEVNDQVHVFIARDRSHLDHPGKIYDLIDHLFQHMKVSNNNELCSLL